MTQPSRRGRIACQSAPKSLACRTTLVAKERDWQLPPAYDLTPYRAISQDHRDLAMDAGDQGRFANIKNHLSQHTRFLFDADEAMKLGPSLRR
jgi:serine/threonine-protein kinase HipA